VTETFEDCGSEEQRAVVTITEDDFACVACGYDRRFGVWDVDEPSSAGFCTCCGIQFGWIDQAVDDPRQRQALYRSWRKEWMTAGMPWRSPYCLPPDDWDPHAQLARVLRLEN